MKKSLLAILFFMSFSLYSQTIEWYNMGSGLSSTVKTVAVIGDDVYTGGIFAFAGGVLVNNIAKWDGSKWSSLGSGINGEVRALAVSGNDLYAAGFFSLAGGVPVNNIAKWDGISWSPLGLGVNEMVLALEVSGADLYAGGFFTEAGGSPASRIAKWNGSSWSPLGSGINNEVNAIAVDGNFVYAGGIFNDAGGALVSGVAKWDGNSWSDVGGGVNGIARAIEIYGTDVYIGGVFTMAGGNVPGRVVKWDGNSWHSLAEGVNGSVFSLQVSADELYVGGMFTTAGIITANRIAKFNLTTSVWSAIGNGATGSIDDMAIQSSTNSMIVGGAFSHVGNNLLANYLARFTDSGNPLPVELISFTASVSGNEVTLQWSTSSETNNLGFEVEKASASLNWSKAGFVEGKGTTMEPSVYSFTDNITDNSKSILYRLKQIDLDGSFTYSKILEVSAADISHFNLLQNYPNPFNPSTEIEFTIESSRYVSLNIYDISGNIVSTLVSGKKPAGTYKVPFDASGLSSGIYIYRLQAGEIAASRKMILIK